MTPLLTASDNASSAAYRKGTDEPVVLVAEGTWGGGTLTLQITPDGGTTWVTTGKTLTANGTVTFDCPAGLQFRATLAGATGGSIDAWISG